MYKAYPEKDFVDVADAIREKTGKSAKLIFPDDYMNEIRFINNGIPMMTDDEWNSLTNQQKKSYEYVAIQNKTTGYNRGLLLYGKDYTSYEYHESNDKKLGVLILENYKVWFFNGLNIPSSQLSIESVYPELQSYFTYNNIHMSKAFLDGNSLNWCGNVGFSYPDRYGFRLLSTSNAAVIGNTIYATLEVPSQLDTPTVSIGGAPVQNVNYETFSDYIISHGLN